MSIDLLQTLLGNAWSILLVVVFFSASIFVHELGHFLAARWRGVKVERFSIGFGPAFWSRRGKDGVEYRIAWVPLGGYVLLPQLADLGPIEGKVESDVEKLPPVSYPSKMLVFAAGALFNVLFAFGLATIIWQIGQPESNLSASTTIGYVSTSLELRSGVKVPSPASQAGLHVGDIIRAIDGHRVTKFVDVYTYIGLGAGKAPDGRRQAIFTIERDGRVFDVTLYPVLAGPDSDRKVGILPGFEMNVAEIAPRSVGAKAGFHPDDVILTLDGQRVLSPETWLDVLEASALRPVKVGIRRDGRERTLTIPPRLSKKSAASIGLSLTTGFMLTYPTPWEQVSAQVTMAFRTLWSLINPHSDIGLSKLSGPVAIVDVLYSSAEAGIRHVLIFTILLNMSLAIFNLLPIPVLDGGQMLFATVGRLRGRPLPVNFIMAANSVFIVLLLTMVLYVSFFDVRRISREHADNAAPPPAPAPAKP